MTEKNIMNELGNIDPKFIEEASPDFIPTQTEALNSQKKVFPIQKKLLAIAASFAIIIGTMSVIGFDNVYSAIRNLFSFIPGVGIEITQTDSKIYTYSPIKGEISEQSTKARLLRAAYFGDTFSASILSDSFLSYDDIKLYINGKEIEDKNDSPNYSLAVANESSLFEIAVSTDEPKETDIYEVELAGLNDKIAFSMKPCSTYEKLSEIGPTVTKNGITITATATRFGDELTVWCYENRSPDATKDTLANIGKPANGANPVVQYIQTSKGKIYDNNGGWQLFGRSVYTLPEDEKSAVLHIPYLAMMRDEKGKFQIDLPQNSTVLKTPYTANTSLGNILITEIKRSPSEHNPDKDTVFLKFSYENSFENMKMYGLIYEINGQQSTAVRYHDQNGTMEYIELEVDKTTDKAELTFDTIYYYLTDEYEFNLDL